MGLPSTSAHTMPARRSYRALQHLGATSASVTGFALDTTCYNEFIVQQQTNNQRPGASPDLVRLHTLALALPSPAPPTSALTSTPPSHPHPHCPPPSPSSSS